MKKRERKITSLKAPNPKFNVGDLIVIHNIKKGIILSAESIKSYYGAYWEYEIYWQFYESNGFVETKRYTEGTILIWLSREEGQGKNNKNAHYPMVKDEKK